MDTLIDVDEDNQWKHDSEFANYHEWRMFYYSWSHVWSQICQRPPSHAHRRRQRQPGQVQQVGMSYFLYIQFFDRNRLRMSMKL